MTYIVLTFPALRRAKVAERQADQEREDRERLSIEKAVAEEKATRVTLLDREMVELREQRDNALANAAKLKSELEGERNHHEARVEELELMGDEIERKFAVLAARALGENSDNFLKLASERFNRHQEGAERDLGERHKAIESLVKPIGDSLTRFEKTVGEIEKARERAYGAVAEQIKTLAEGQAGLRTETGRLVQALRRPKSRGRWGEYQLRNVLEMAGMTAHIDFAEERTIDGPGGQLRPDAVIRIPGGKSVIVDAKTPLEGYLHAVESDDEDERERGFRNHARQVQQHVRQLSSKEYWNAQEGSPDFVVMFIPGEAFLSAAFERDPGLFESAVGRRVLIATPMTLIALVKAVAFGWQQQKLADSADEIASLGRDLYSRIKTFGEHMGELGRTLGRVVEGYNKSVGSLERRLLPAARRFGALGVVSAGEEIGMISQIEVEPRTPMADEFGANSANEASAQDY